MIGREQIKVSRTPVRVETGNFTYLGLPVRMISFEKPWLSKSGPIWNLVETGESGGNV